MRFASRTSKLKSIPALSCRSTPWWDCRLWSGPADICREVIVPSRADEVTFRWHWMSRAVLLSERFLIDHPEACASLVNLRNVSLVHLEIVSLVHLKTSTSTSTCTSLSTSTSTSTPTPPHRSLILKDHCLCLQDSKKDDEVAVPVGAREHERHYPTPPHPTPPSLPACRTARKMMRLLCLWVHGNMNVIIPPHPTPPHPTPPHPTPPSLPVSAGQQERWWGCCACGCTGTWTLLSHPTPPHPTPPHPTTPPHLGAQVSDFPGA